MPEKRQELTTEGGLECVKNKRKLALVVKRLKKAGIEVSAFIVADPDQINTCGDVGCDAIELHTGPYANAKSDRQITRKIKELTKARDLGMDWGMTIHAGHGLNYRNIAQVAQIEGLEDFNIGHSIVARSVFIGIRQATAEMIALIDKFSMIG